MTTTDPATIRDRSVPILEIGGSHVTAATVDPAQWEPGQVNRLELDPDSGADELIAAFVRAADALDIPPGRHWGIAMPGPFDYGAGIGQFSGVGKFDALRGVDVRGRLIDALAAHPSRITFVNDADAFLLGEWLAGAAQHAGRCAAVTLGTGVGSAFLADGAIVTTGAEVPPDGEAHLLIHDGRPLEDFVSRRAIRRAFAAAEPTSSGLDVREIFDRARSGDPVAGTVIDDAFVILGQVLGPWLARFRAEVLVLGGSISRSFDLIEKPLQVGLSAAAELPVRLTADAERSALIGAAYPAFTAL